ncbi:MAG: hypothetical protein Q4D33_08630 [Prevotellaceae bacterium]|nr:hypothetical protein [Prevotellaceae bacterium]
MNNTYNVDVTMRQEKMAPVKKSPVVNQFDVITRRYRSFYANCWIDRSTAAKFECLERAIKEKSTSIYTRDVFLQEFARRVDLLLDSKHFRDAVEALVPPLKPYDVATHIVVLGWKELEEVLLHEGYKTLRSFPEWTEPIYGMDVLNPYLENPQKMIEDKREATA